MRIAVDALAIDTPDPDALAMFYEDLLGFRRTFEGEGEVMIAAPDGSGFPLVFFEVDDEKVTKNRLHLDLRPDDQAAAVRKALDLGATHVDIGQHEDPDVTWVVLADPDGNEFCLLATDGAVSVLDVPAVEDLEAADAPEEDDEEFDGDDEEYADYDDEEE